MRAKAELGVGREHDQTVLLGELWLRDKSSKRIEERKSPVRDPDTLPRLAQCAKQLPLVDPAYLALRCDVHFA